MSGKSPPTPDILSRWSRMAMPVEGAPSGARRQRLVGVIARSIEQTAADQRRRRYFVRIAWGAAAAVGCMIVLVLTIGRRREPQVGARVQVLSGTVRSTVDGRPSDQERGGEIVLPPHAAVRTGPRSSIHARLASGVEVTAGPDAELVLPNDPSASAAEELNLKQGAIAVNVPKLSPGHTFVVHTADALVTVHGTSFSVEFTAGGLGSVPVTKVKVSQGIVTARHGIDELLLSAGMEWTSVPQANPGVPSSSASDSSLSVAAIEGSAAKGVQPPKPALVGSAQSRRTTERAGASTDLGDQNRLFQSAMLAQERGDDALAVRILDDFLAQFPSSPLDEDAHVQRFRALARMHSAKAAARAARRYLGAYPQGFAAAEARRLVFEKRGQLGISR